MKMDRCCLPLIAVLILIVAAPVLRAARQEAIRVELRLGAVPEIAQRLHSEHGAIIESIGAFLHTQYPLWQFDDAEQNDAALILVVTALGDGDLLTRALLMDVTLRFGDGSERDINQSAVSLYLAGAMRADWRLSKIDFSMAFQRRIASELRGLHERLQDQLKVIRIADGVVGPAGEFRVELPLDHDACCRLAQSIFMLSCVSDGSRVAVISAGTGVRSQAGHVVVRHLKFRPVPGLPEEIAIDEFQGDLSISVGACDAVFVRDLSDQASVCDSRLNVARN